MENIKTVSKVVYSNLKGEELREYNKKENERLLKEFKEKHGIPEEGVTNE